MVDVNELKKAYEESQKEKEVLEAAKENKETQDVVEKIEVASYVNSFKQLKDQEKIQAKVKEAIALKYVPFVLKYAAAKQSVNKACATPDGELELDYAMLQHHFYVAIISLYTNLDINAMGATQTYDALRASGLMDLIINEIGRDIDEFRNVYESTIKNFEMDRFDNRRFIARQVSRFAEVCKDGFEIVGEFVKKINTDQVNKIIEDKLKK